MPNTYTVIMLGPSGSGKTTLLSLIGGLRTVSEGSLRFMGRELSHAPDEILRNVRSQIGFVFQHYNLLPFLTAEQNVRLSLELHPYLSAKELYERPKAVLEAVGMAGHASAYPAKLSGGQKQRVSIARALAPHPKLVLADEPTAALDSHAGRDVVKILRNLAHTQNCAILIVTHDNRILDIADRRIHVEDGFLSCFES